MEFFVMAFLTVLGCFVLFCFLFIIFFLCIFKYRFVFKFKIFFFIGFQLKTILKLNLQFLLEDARSNETIPKPPTKSYIPSSLDANADTTVTLPLRRPSSKEIDDKGELNNEI